jgi:hypothetical protein
LGKKKTEYRRQQTGDRRGKSWNDGILEEWSTGVLEGWINERKRVEIR